MNLHDLSGLNINDNKIRVLKLIICYNGMRNGSYLSLNNIPLSKDSLDEQIQGLKNSGVYVV